ncbi:MAG: YceI family protein [Myxococcales bacterium]|nr:YceI family protein [Myxococcales bacterium]
MNRLRLAGLAGLFALLSTPAFAAPGSMQLKGQAKWVSDAPVEKIVGTAEGTGELSIDLDDLTTLKGKITMPVESMKTGNGQRDEHLKGSDWLDAAQFPNIEFTVAEVKITQPTSGDPIKEAKVEVSGDFSLHGVTTRLTAPATLKWKGNQVKIATAFQIKLADYQVKGKSGVVGNKVGETIAIDVDIRGEIK